MATKSLCWKSHLAAEGLKAAIRKEANSTNQQGRRRPEEHGKHFQFVQRKGTHGQPLSGMSGDSVTTLQAKKAASVAEPMVPMPHCSLHIPPPPRPSLLSGRLPGTPTSKARALWKPPTLLPPVPGVQPQQSSCSSPPPRSAWPPSRQHPEKVGCGTCYGGPTSLTPRRRRFRLVLHCWVRITISQSKASLRLDLPAFSAAFDQPP